MNLLQPPAYRIMPVAPSPQLPLTRPSMPEAPIQSPSQADVTIKELRLRMGEDVGLLSYLPHEKVRAATFDNLADSGGHPLPVRILFGKLEQDKSPPRGVWALLHNKPGSSRPPECRLKIFSRSDKLEEPITLDEAMEQASPMPAFTCLKTRQGRWDRGHLSSVLRYYFILQKPKLPSPWPISEIFISELKGACRVAKANAEKNLLEPKGHRVVASVTARTPGASTRPQDLTSPLQHTGVYTVSHRAIKGSRPGSAITRSNSQQQGASANKRLNNATVGTGCKRPGVEEEKLSLAELLFGEAAEAALSAQAPAPPSAETPTPSPEKFVTAYRRSITGKEEREKLLVNNLERQASLRSELEDLEEEAQTLKTALSKSKAERKRLRTSISARDVAFLQLGQDLAQEGSKRMRFEDSGEE